MSSDQDNAARGTAKQRGLEHLDPIERAGKRHQAYMGKLLQDTVSELEKNAVLADADTAEELGIFDDKPEGWQNLHGAQRFEFAGEEFDEQRQKGFLVRARRDALTAKLNSITIFKRVERLASELRVAAFIVVGLLIYIAINVSR